MAPAPVPCPAPAVTVAAPPTASVAPARPPVTLAAIVNLTYRYEHGRLKDIVNPTHEEAVDWLSTNVSVRDSATVAVSTRKDVPFPSSAIGTAHYVNAVTDSDAATLFWEAVATGADLKSGDPILALRRWVVTTAAGRDRPKTEIILCTFLKAMNQWRAGRSVKILSWKLTEEVPEPWSS